MRTQAGDLMLNIAATLSDNNDHPMMGRRAFITMVTGSILAAPLAVDAQQTGKVYRIGHVSLNSAEEMAPYLQAFEEGFRELGYLKGRDFIIESRSANGNPELVSAAAAELVAKS